MLIPCNYTLPVTFKEKEMMGKVYGLVEFGDEILNVCFNIPFTTKKVQL